MAHHNIRRTLLPSASLLILFSSLLIPAAFAQDDPDAEAAPPPTPPNLAYSDLGSGNTYNPSEGFFESGGAASGKSKVYAMPFQVDSSYTYYMSQVSVALNQIRGSAKVKIVFAQDDGGAPGPAISTKSATISASYGTCCSLVSVTYPSSGRDHITLSPGVTYWVETVLPEGEVALWNENVVGQGGTGAVSTDGGMTWTPTPLSLFGAFAVYGYILIQG